MLKAFTAFTNEIDNIEQAVSELVTQLDMRDKLLKNSVGIISCYAEYLDSGVVKALSSRLPFDLLGTTTIANASRGEVGEMMLTLMVLTSDDMSFSVGLTEPILGESEEPIRAAYEAAAAKLPQKANLIISFAPLLLNVGGDYFINAFDRITGGVPNFGTITVDNNADYHEASIIFNGEAYRDRYAFILAEGNIAPTFYVGNISEERVFAEKGAVTAAVGNQLQAVNGVSVTDYLLSIGLTKDDSGMIPGINSFPIIVDYNDGTSPVARAMFALTPEGYAVCGGDIPVGATLSIGEFDALEIQDTARRTLQQAVEKSGKSIFLMYSCVGRYFAQGSDQLVEAEGIRDIMQQACLPYLFAYSGGELCPVHGHDGSTSNRNHNNTLIICAL